MTDPGNVVSLADHRARAAARRAAARQPPADASLAALPEHVLDLMIRNDVEDLIRQHGSFREAVVSLEGSADPEDRVAAAGLRDWARETFPDAEAV